MGKQLRIWLFVLLGTLLTSTSLLAEDVIIMTTSKTVGNRIWLKITANGNVTIDGLEESAQTNGQSKYYTITNQTITIRGDVTKLDCRDLYNSSGSLTSLDVSGCAALIELNCSGNKLTRLNASDCTGLKELDCFNNQLTNLNVSGCTALTLLHCSSNQLTSLNVSGCTALTTLDCSWNQLTSLNVSGCTSLTKLNCYRNQLTSLDVSGCTALTTLECPYNQLTSLNVSGCTALTSLSCPINNLTGLNATGCTALTDLDCSENQLTSLNVTGCTALTRLECYKNRLKGETMTQMVAGLSDRNGKGSGSLYVVCDEADENDLLKSDILTASRKNWRVFKYIVNTGKSVLYSGAGEGEIVMSITQEQNVARRIRLAILADGDVTIEGVNEREFFSDGSEHTYTIAGDQVIIRGNITELDCSKNQLINIDVSKSPSLWTLKCSDNKLTSLNASSCPLLTKLDCSNNPLTSINLNGTLLEKFLWRDGALTSLDVSGCVSLTKLDCRNNQLISLKVSGCTALTELYCVDNQLTSLDVSDCTSLKRFDCSNNQLSDLNASGCTALTWVDYKQNPLTSINLAGCILLDNLSWLGSELSSLDVSGCTSLTKLYCDTKLTSLDVSGCTALTELYCSENQLTSLDVSGCTALTSLVCNNNQLTSLDVSGCTALTKLECHYNQLTSLDASGCAALTKLYCYRNQLPSLDASGCTSLTELSCSSNQLTSLNVSGCTALTKFECDKNQLSSLDVSDCTALTKLDCNNNQLTSLDLSGCAFLTRLVCSENPLTSINLSNCKSLTEFLWTYGELVSLDMSSCSNLTVLGCNSNQLTSLNVSGCTALTRLDCDSNQLTSLDVSGCTALKELNCCHNSIDGEAMTKLMNSLPNRHGMSSGDLIVVSRSEGEGNLCRLFDVDIARGKNWYPQWWENRTSYEGVGDGLISMTSAVAIGETIALSLQANGDVVIDGVRESPKLDGKVHNYTLTRQTISIRGNVTMLNCSINQLTSLDLSKDSALTALNCSNNQLTSLDVSKDSALTALDCSSNQLTRLDVPDCTVLTQLDCRGNQLTSLNASGCTALTKLDCQENPLISISLSSCKSLKEFFWANGKLASLNVSGCTDLTKLDCSDNQLTNLNVSGCSALTELGCYSNQLTSLDVSGCSSLTSLNCYGNQISGENMTSLVNSLPSRKGMSLGNFIVVSRDDIEGNLCRPADITIAREKNWSPKRQNGTSYNGVGEGIITITTTKTVGETVKLKIVANGDVVIEGVREISQVYGDYTITNQTLTIRGDVTELSCSHNQLSSLDLSQNSTLTELDCRSNQLTSLNVSGCTALTNLYCSDNRLTSLDVSGCTILTTLDCSSNPLTSINLSGCQSLKSFSWFNRYLTNLDASGCTALTELTCWGNQLTSLDVSGCTALTKLDCDNNQLTSVDVSGCTALKELYCQKNQLTRLNVLGCTALTKLYCYDNQLTSLDVSGCTALTELDCYGNQINGEGMTKLVNSLPDRKGMSSGTLLVVEYSSYKKDQNWCSFADIATASEKNWVVLKYMSDKYVNDKSRRVSYSGIGEGVITITTSKAVGEKIKLRIEANGDVVIEGVSERPYLSDRHSKNYTLTSQTITIRGDVTSIDCDDNQLTNLDVSKNTVLTSLSCSKNQLTSVDVSKNAALTKLDCSKNQLTVLNVSGCTALTTLDCYDNQLTSLDVSKNTVLKWLNCSYNQLTSLDVSSCTALTELKCYKNHLKGKFMTQMVAELSNRIGKESGSLYVVCDEADENNILRSDVLTASRKNWRVFKYIVNTGKSVLYSGAGGDDEIVMTITQEQYLAGGIRLAILADGDVTIDGVHEKRIFTDGSKHTYTLAGTQITIRGNVTELDCSKNQLTNIDVSTSTSLWILRCSDNKLTSLDLSGFTALTELYCSYNKLTSLDVSKNTNLTSLGCSDNQLTSLDVSQNSALTSLGCNDNQLTSLDVSKNSALTSLYCSSNQLTSLDASCCPALTELGCSDNQINGKAMTKLVNSLPDRMGLSSGTLLVVNTIRDKNWCSFADVATASEKNWAVQKYDPYYSWTSYSGVGEGVITMTTSKAVGEKVELRIVANGDVVIEGASESPQLGRNPNNYTLTSQTIIIRGDVTELDCSRNKLETLNLSACSNLKSLSCYRNKIRGNAVAQLVESLPDRYGKEPGKFYFVYYSNDVYEDNFCYRPAVGRANDKNWRPQKRYYDGWEDYFGVMDEGVVMMRTAQEVGSQITLTLEAKGDVAIDGVKGVPETDGKPHQYTLLSQDVTIRGYVTKLHCSGNKLTSLDLSTTAPLVELDCSNNQLTALDVSQNAALTSLACYRNQIKGEAMAQLIKGLPQLPLRSTHLFGIVSNAADEGNVFFKADVERVQDKGWSPMKWNEERQQYEPYAGKETESFAVTLTKEGEGTINATGADDLTAVPYGTELTIVATPAEGYELISLTAGEEDILATKKLIVTDNVTVKATFDEATFAVSLKKEGEGTISATGASDLNAVAYGTELTINATPAMGYELTALTANGTDILTTKKVVIKGATEVKATFVDHTGVETTVTQQVKLYPNPATDYVIVEGVAPASEVTLHSMTGERLYAGRADNRGVLQIDLTPYADGVYLVCVAGETYRIVVRH